jgi:hypothetical protein
MPGDLKRTVYYQKIELDITYWPRKKNLQVIFFSNLEKKALYVNGEYDKRQKSVNIKHISVNNRNRTP